MNAKDKWINEVENSLQGIQPVDTNPYLYSKIVNRLNSVQKDYAPSKLVWLAVGSFTILIFLNIVAISVNNTFGKSQVNELESVSRQMQLINDNSINYN
jgi:hypothetical protein